MKKAESKLPRSGRRGFSGAVRLRAVNLVLPDRDCLGCQPTNAQCTKLFSRRMDELDIFSFQDEKFLMAVETCVAAAVAS